jgi:uncharacterized surface protein with fasciclin (FAS1) repeats
MRNRYSTLLLILVPVALAVAGCDQSMQTAEPDTANRYIISQKTSAVGDAVGVDIQASTDTVTAPDTVSYAVQGFTVNKDYNWTLNDEDMPVETRSNSSYVWEAREGEFVTVVFTQNDPMANVNPDGATTNTLRINSPDDNINAEQIEITTAAPTIDGQISRLGNYSTAAGFASDAGLAATLDGDGPFTLFAPTNEALGALPAEPTQATDADESVTSSVLGDILKYHAIPADVVSGDISDGQTAQTLFGDQTVEFSTGNGVSVNGGQASVIKPDFPATNGAIHGIDGVLLPSTASVDFTNRTVDSLSAGGMDSDPDSVTVDGSFIPEDGGFVVLHDSTELQNQGAIQSIVGASEYIGPNSIANEVEVELDEAISDTTTIGAMPHRDSNDNQSYDFPATGGTEDGPYTLEGAPVLDYGILNIQ